MRKILSIVSATIIATSLVACSGTKTAPTNAVAPSAQSQTTEAVTEPPVEETETEAEPEIDKNEFYSNYGEEIVNAMKNKYVSVDASENGVAFNMGFNLPDDEKASTYFEMTIGENQIALGSLGDDVYLKTAFSGSGEESGVFHTVVTTDAEREEILGESMADSIGLKNDDFGATRYVETVEIDGMEFDVVELVTEDTEADVETEADTEIEADVETESDTEIEADTETASDTEIASDTETEADTEAEGTESEDIIIEEGEIIVDEHTDEETMYAYIDAKTHELAYILVKTNDEEAKMTFSDLVDVKTKFGTDNVQELGAEDFSTTYFGAMMGLIFGAMTTDTDLGIESEDDGTSAEVALDVESEQAVN